MEEEKEREKHKKGENLKDRWRQRFGAIEKEGRNRFDSMRKAEETYSV